MKVSESNSKVDDETALIASDVSEKIAIALDSARGAEMGFVAYLLTMALAEARELADPALDDTLEGQRENKQ